MCQTWCSFFLTEDTTVALHGCETRFRHRPPQLLVALLAISPDSSLDAIFGMYHSSQHCLKSCSPIFCTHPHDELSLCGVIIAFHQKFSVSGIGPR